MPPARRWLALMLVVVAAYAATAVATRTPYHIWGDDWAQYVNHARNLAEHRDYSDTGYMFNSSRPNIGPRTYPPGTAILLAPLESRFGTDIKALKLLSIACLAATLIVTYLLLVPVTGRPGALAAAVLFGLHPMVWAYTGYVVSEPPFVLLSIGALLCARWRRDAASGISVELVGAIMTGVLVAFAIACRSIGVTLVAALFLYECVNARWRRPWIWVVLATVGGCQLAQKHLFGSADYSNELAQHSIGRMLQNLHGYWGATAQLLPLHEPLTTVVPALIIALIARGLYILIRENGVTRIAWPQLHAILRSVPLEIWYLCCYIGALIVLPFAPHGRYLMAVLPIILGFVTYGLSTIVPPRRAAVVLVVVLAAGWYSWLWVREPRVDLRGGALCADCLALYDAVQANVGSDDAVAFAKPRALAFMTRRHAWIWSADHGAQDTWRDFRVAGVTWLVTVNPSHELAPIYPEFLGWDGWRSQSAATLVYENPGFRLIRLNLN